MLALEAWQALLHVPVVCFRILASWLTFGMPSATRWVWQGQHLLTPWSDFVQLSRGACKFPFLSGPWSKPVWRSYRSARVWLQAGPVRLRSSLQRGPRCCLSSPAFSRSSDFIFQLVQGIGLCLQMASKEFPWRRKAPVAIEPVPARSSSVPTPPAWQLMIGNDRGWKQGISLSFTWVIEANYRFLFPALGLSLLGQRSWRQDLLLRSASFSCAHCFKEDLTHSTTGSIFLRWLKLLGHPGLMCLGSWFLCVHRGGFPCAKATDIGRCMCAILVV